MVLWDMRMRRIKSTSVLLVVFISLRSIAGDPRLNSLTEELSISLNGLFNSTIADFSDSYPPCSASVTNKGDLRNKTLHVVQLVASSLSDKFMSIEKALQDSVALAGDLYGRETISGYSIDGNCSSSSPCVTELGYDVLHEQNVLFYSSLIHIPRDICTHDPSVLKFVEWTSALEDHFASQSLNLTSAFDVTYQYFGNRQGVLRLYPAVCPASKSTTSNKCYRCPYPSEYTFHSRWQPWYTSTVPGPKFIVILIDMSGSMTGRRIQLARLTAVQILNSLSVDDFFLVIKVGDGNTTKPLDCFSKKSHASSKNILIASEVLLQDNSATVGHANFNQALVEALAALNDSCDCERIIVLLTDKDADNVKQSTAMIEDREQLDEVRVFVFLVGPGSNSQLEDIARNNGGKVYEVRDYGDILNQTGTFVDDLSSLLVTPESVNDVHWSHYKSGFGDLVLTGSLAFTRLGNNSESNEFIGVMGIDVGIKSIQGLFSNFSALNLCGRGYVFMIDSSGQLIVHPRIDNDYIKNNLFSDDFISFDIRYFEHAHNMTKLELLKSAMVNREDGSITIPTWIPTEKEKRYLMRNITYYYAPVDNTPFSVAIALPSGQPEDWCVSDNFSISEGVMFNESSSHFGRFPNKRIFVQLFNGQLKCIDGFIIDCSNGSFPDVCQYLNLHLEGGDVNGTLNLYAGPHDIVAVKDLPVNQLSILTTSGVPTDGVVGVVIDKQNLTDFISASVMSHNGTDDTTLYLLDSNAFILWTSDNNHSQAYGQPFAKYQPAVFDDLIDEGVFVAGTFAKHGPRTCCTCGETNSTCFDSAGFSIHKSVLLSLMKLLSWLITDGLKTLVLTSYYSVLKGLSSLPWLHVYAPTVRCGTDNCPINLCLVDITGVQLHPDFQNSTNQINCPDNKSETTISYVIRRVEYTNIVVLETNGSCPTPTTGGDNHILLSSPICAMCMYTSCNC